MLDTTCRYSSRSEGFCTNSRAPSSNERWRSRGFELDENTTTGTVGRVRCRIENPDSFGRFKSKITTSARKSPSRMIWTACSPSSATLTRMDSPARAWRTISTSPGLSSMRSTSVVLTAAAIVLIGRALWQVYPTLLDAHHYDSGKADICSAGSGYGAARNRISSPKTECFYNSSPLLNLVGFEELFWAGCQELIIESPP